MNWTFTLLLLPGLLVGITVHEFAHAWSASLLGDDFARRQGRVSLNPLRHLSPLGTLAILILPFGWGKPVPINLYNLRRPRRDYLISSLAGPLANLVTVAVAIGLMHLTRHTFAFGELGMIVLFGLHALLYSVVVIGVILAVINLIPIPPLDGSKIWAPLLGRKASFGARSSGLFLILVFFLFWRGTFDAYVSKAYSAVESFVPVADWQVFSDRLAEADEAMREGHLAEAEEMYGKAIAINPYAYEAFGRRAQLRAARGDWQAALEDADRLIGRGSPVPEGYELRASIHDALGHADLAQQDRRQAESLRHAAAPTGAAPDVPPAPPTAD